MVQPDQMLPLLGTQQNEGGQPSATAHGVDIDGQGNGTVVEPRLYQLIRQPAPISGRHFEIEFLDSGVEALDFTFG
jgi:Thioredoxin like C-terminal domain